MNVIIEKKMKESIWSSSN